jgi:PmbA protein
VSAALRGAARAAVRASLEAGATGADALAASGRTLRLVVRRGELESSEQSESRGVGVRAFRGARQGTAWTSDLSGEGLRTAGRQAAALAALAGEDEGAGLPDAAHRAASGADTDAADPSFEDLDPAEGLAAAREAEAAAFAADSRITNSSGATFRASRGAFALVASDGFEASHRRTAFHLSVAPVAEGEGGVQQRDHAWTASTVRARMDAPAAVGREAAARCVRRLGWRKPPTREVPVVFEPEVAAELAGHLARACNGDLVRRRASFLAGRLGETVASPLLTLVDDPGLPGGFGSRPFDGEGAAARRKALVERGVLRGFLLDSYHARRIGGPGAVPGNACRGVGGGPSPGTTNLGIAAGDSDPADIVAGVEEGLLVTEMMGFGVDLATGSFSQGAAGIRIVGGRLDHAVQEVTISGSLSSILRGIDAVGNDLRWKGDVAAPTIRVARMTVGGA